MTANGWIQIAIYAVLVTICVKPLGAYMAQVFSNQRTFLSPVLEPIERGIYRLSGIDEKSEQHWVTYTVAMLLFSLASFILALWAAAAAGCAAVQSAGNVRGRGNLFVQHRRQLYNQHQLAGLRWRDDNELSDPDGRSHRAEFRVGGGRHRARHRTDPWLCPTLGEYRRQFLGRSDPVHALCAVAAVDCCRAGTGSAGDAAEPRQLCRRNNPRRRQADNRAGAGCLADSRSSSSARMVAVSSTPIPACPTRTRTRSPT